MLVVVQITELHLKTLTSLESRSGLVLYQHQRMDAGLYASLVPSKEIQFPFCNDLMVAFTCALDVPISSKIMVIKNIYLSTGLS